MNNNADLYSLMENLPRNDPAWNLLDAFDAVTNGMENPEAMKKLSQLKDPALEPWKLLVKAIAALYSGDGKACRAAADKISVDSAPGCLKPLFYAWVVRQTTRDEDALFRELAGCPRAAAELFDRLIMEHPLSSLAEQAEEALRQGLEEQFTILASRVLSGLEEAGKIPALRYTVYCLTLVQEEGAGESLFQAALAKILGESDSFCALGLSLLAGKDNRRALAAFKQALAAPRSRKSAGSQDIFLSGARVKILEELLRLLEGRPAAAPKQKRKQPDLFLPPLEIIQSGTPVGAAGTAVPVESSDGEILGLAAALIKPAASFADIEADLPPAARYLGPGIWIKAIKDSQSGV